MVTSPCFVFLASQVFLAKRKHDGKYYAVKVLQKKVILNRKEVTFPIGDLLDRMSELVMLFFAETLPFKLPFQSAKTHHGRAKRVAEECEAPLSGRTSLFLSDRRQVVLRLGFRQWRRSESFQLGENEADTSRTHMTQLWNEVIQDRYSFE